MPVDKSLSPSYAPGLRDSNKMYYIIIPNGVNKEEYIQQVFRTNQVSITDTKGDCLHNCRVSKTCLPLIEFPEEGETFGSMVLGTYIPEFNKVVVTHVFNKIDQSDFYEEGQNALEKNFEKSYSGVGVSAKQNYIYLRSFSDQPNKISIACVNENFEDSIIEIETSGSINKQANTINQFIEDKSTLTVADEDQDENELIIEIDRQAAKFKTIKEDEIQSEVTINQEGFSYSDINENQIDIKEEQIDIKAKSKVNLGNGDEKIILGDTFINKLSLFLDAVIAGTAGPYPFSPQFIQSAQQFKSELNSTLSQYSNTD